VAEPPSTWRIEHLQKRHDRTGFYCGVDELDEYLRRFAGQNEKGGISQHFAAVPEAGAARVLGYYALSAGAVAFDRLPVGMKKRLPRYPIPVAHLDRLAVDRSMQGRGLGQDLLIDAFNRTMRAADQIGIHAIEVVAINDSARRFYRQYLPDSIDSNDHIRQEGHVAHGSCPVNLQVGASR